MLSRTQEINVEKSQVRSGQYGTDRNGLVLVNGSPRLLLRYRVSKESIESTENRKQERKVVKMIELQGVTTTGQGTSNTSNYRRTLYTI